MKNYWLFNKPTIAVQVSMPMMATCMMNPQPLEKNNFWKFDLQPGESLHVDKCYVYHGMNILYEMICDVTVRYDDTFSVELTDELYNVLINYG